MLKGGNKMRLKAYELGIGLVQQAFKRDNTLAACMGPLGNHLLIQNAQGQGIQQVRLPSLPLKYGRGTDEGRMRVIGDEIV